MTEEKNPLGLKKIHHVEFYVGNAKQADFYYRKAFGFSRAAFSGLETGNRDSTSYVLRQNRVNFILTTPLNEEHEASEHIKVHGDGVKDIAFQVEDADAAFNEAVKRGAEVAIEPYDWKDENGSVRRAAIKTYGDTIHSFISYNTNNGHNYSGAFLPGFTENVVEGDDVGIVLVDHVVGNVELGKMNVWCDYYRDVMGFERYMTFDDKDISTEYSSLMSIVMSDSGHNIKFPINEPAEGKGGKSQIQEYIEYYNSAGVQHLALLCKDIRHTVTILAENGVEFLSIPDTYYENLLDRIGDIDEDIESLKKLGILVDKDDEGYLLQIFTKPVEDRPTVFYEILQRKGCKGFGKGNFKALFVSIEEEQRKRGNL
ncbi:MAG: 4-hydroxyphenylpyruvate dioxygenase [Acidobacteriota bacterium]|jgi:4-hydroxyphenylpyruvate dioxygenase|nr:4-hydroxyphenylpyruvate dioxygenase [Acidobacteriota bacterium]